MLAKAAGMARCCALLSSTRVFSGFKSANAVSNFGCKLVGAKPVVRLPGSAWTKRKTSSFVTRAGGDSGPLDSPLIASMQSKIKEQLGAESVTVKDENGDGRHVSISVVSTAFEGKSEVNRQRMVYKAIWEELQTTVHAVDKMTTKTPQEAAT